MFTAFFLSLFVAEVIRLEAIVVGSILAVMITLVHVSLLGKIVRRYNRKCRKVETARHPVTASYSYFAGAILLMLLVHILDTCIWALVLYVPGLVPEIHHAFYFAANTYTTLGYGDVPLSADWKELAPIMAICGLFTFGCTTSQLFDVMSSHNKSIEELSSKSN
jgi:hypothetical protein